MKSFGYAATSAGEPLTPLTFERRDPGPRDLVLDLMFCGICHSDLHFVNDDWGVTRYPVVPGHEIVGKVRTVGAEVTNHSVGDIVAIGCLIDSCRSCDACKEGDEPSCFEHATQTYGGFERGTDIPTHGGYSTSYVINADYALKVPDALDPAAAAPLLCAGITTYSPLRQWQVGPGDRVGVVGLGGLGHMGIKFAAAFGAEVVAITSSPAKVEDARRLGAHDVIVSTDRAALKRNRGALSFVLDTVSAPHDVNRELSLLRRRGTLCLVGLPPEPMPISAAALVLGRKQLVGSNIGGIAETQEMLDFCAEHDIVSDIELVAVTEIEDAFKRVAAGQVRYRAVIDLGTLTPA
jgi:uncharacterized zinc-type alcohol dehydrogenase-like protein